MTYYEKRQIIIKKVNELIKNFKWEQFRKYSRLANNFDGGWNRETTLKIKLSEFKKGTFTKEEKAIIKELTVVEDIESGDYIAM